MGLFGFGGRREAGALAEIDRIRHAKDPGPRDTDRLYELLRQSQDRRIRAAAVQALRVLQDRFPGVMILVGRRMVGIDARAQAAGSFFLFVLDVFGIEGQGAVATGIVASGTVTVGQPLVLEKADGRDLPTRCTRVDHLGGAAMAPGAQVGVFLADLTMGEIGQGDALRGV